MSKQGRHIPQLWGFVEALLIMHNILIEYGDDPQDIEGFNGQEDEDGGPSEMAEDNWVHGVRE
jgi:hypothetical protein